MHSFLRPFHDVALSDLEAIKIRKVYSTKGYVQVSHKNVFSNFVYKQNMHGLTSHIFGDLFVHICNIKNSNMLPESKNCPALLNYYCKGKKYPLFYERCYDLSCRGYFIEMNDIFMLVRH